jgi:hypothetical protein
MRRLLTTAFVAATVATTVAVATPALAADAPQAQPQTAAVARKRVTSTMMHYPTLEKMLRRFSRQAGEARTRG